MKHEERIDINKINTIYVDTSVLIAFYFEEKESPIAQHVFNQKESLVLSNLNKVEFISVFRKKMRIGHTTEKKIQNIFFLFNNHQKNNL